MTALVLKEEVARDRVAEVLQGLDLVLEPKEGHEGLFWQVWMAADQKSAVHYCEDSIADVHYLSVRGKKAALLMKKLRKALPVWTRDDLLKHALVLLMDGSDKDRRRVAMEIACDLGDEYDPASTGVLQAFLEMDDPSIRRAGARAFRMLPIPILRPTAEELAADADPEIAGHGRGLLARIQQLHGDGAEWYARHIGLPAFLVNPKKSDAGAKPAVKRRKKVAKPARKAE
jgi:hypothetical protein